MKKAVGITAIIAGALGILVALMFLIGGGLAVEVSPEDADGIFECWRRSMAFSLLAVIYGALVFSQPRAAGVGLMLVSLGDMMAGGTLDGLIMVACFIGGILALLVEVPAGSGARWYRWPSLALAAIPPLCLVLYFLTQSDRVLPEALANPPASGIATGYVVLPERRGGNE